MSSPSIISAAIVVSLSTIVVEVANAKGTFRLQGPWPSVSVANLSTPNLSAHDVIGGCAEGGGLATPIRTAAVARQTSGRIGDRLAVAASVAASLFVPIKGRA